MKKNLLRPAIDNCLINGKIAGTHSDVVCFFQQCSTARKTFANSRKSLKTTCVADTNGSIGGWCMYDDDKTPKCFPGEQVSHRRASLAGYNRYHLRQQPLETFPHTAPASLKANVPRSDSVSHTCSPDRGASCLSSSSSHGHVSHTSCFFLP